MKFAAIALVAAVAAHETGKPHEHPVRDELLKDMKFIATELKEINGDLQKLDKIEWRAEEVREKEIKEHHKHPHHPHHKPDHKPDHKPHHPHHKPDHKPHHPHHKPHHPHHKPDHKKEEGDSRKIQFIQLEQIVEGVLKGAVNAEGFNDIATCIQDVETVLGDAQTAIKDFKAGGASNVIAGLKEVGELLTTVKKGMTDCSETSADWKRLEDMAKTIASPSSFAYHVGKDLLVNGQDIFTDIATAVQDYESEQWEDFGEQVGRAAAKTILGKELDAALAGGKCRDNGDKNSCDAAGCSWCTSFAVANACNSVEDAKKLPSAVFVCDNLTANDLFLF